MAGTTATLALPFPNPGDPNNVPADLQALADRLEAVLAATAAGIGPLLAGYAEAVVDLGAVAGAVDLDVAAGNVWTINPTGAVTFTVSNLPAAGHVAPGTIIVANSAHAITWPAGTRFPGGTAPELDGETFLSVVARPSGLTVGAAWSAVA